jgi:hypothetical protein
MMEDDVKCDASGQLKLMKSSCHYVKIYQRFRDPYPGDGDRDSPERCANLIN